jgi:hypothetical protein
MDNIGLNANTYITSAERDLFKHVFALNETAIAWTDEERSTF